MITQETIKEVTDRLIKVYNPEKLYLFGSHAWGTPHEESDLDVMVIVPESEEKSYRRTTSGDRALYGLPISWDLIVYTKDEFSDRANDASSLCYKIKKAGKLLYAKS